jgi:hypothetical protein
MYGISREVVLAKIPRVVDNTILATFRGCQHKALWEYVFKLTPSAPNINLHAGGAFSKALEALYRSAYNGTGGGRVEDLARAKWAFEKAWGEFDSVPEGSNKTKERTWECVLSYVMEYDPPNDYIRPSRQLASAFEYTFAVPLTKEVWGVEFPRHPVFDEPFLYAGRFDMIGEQGGHLRIRDDKLTTQLGPTWDRSWTLRSQFIGYVAAMQALGVEVDTVEIRGVQPLRETINHKTAVKSFSDEVIWRWTRQIQRDLERFIHSAQEEDWSFNFADMCSMYGGCAFLDLCRANQPEDYFESFARREWNPLEVRT